VEVEVEDHTVEGLVTAEAVVATVAAVVATVAAVVATVAAAAAVVMAAAVAVAGPLFLCYPVWNTAF
jgi:hypothetical protein